MEKYYCLAKIEAELKLVIKIVLNSVESAKKFGNNITKAECKMAQLLRKLLDEFSEAFVVITEPCFGKSLLDFYKNNVLVNLIIGVAKRESCITGEWR